MKGSLLLFTFVVLVLANCAGPQRFQKPQVRTQRELDYPLSAQLDKIEGDVLVGVFVNVDGQPETVKVFESSGNAELDSAALRFAGSIEYTPALLDGNKIASWTKLLLKYKLTEVPFNKDTWLHDVSKQLSLLNKTKDPNELQMAQQRLYLQYLGLISYIDKYEDITVNDTIRDIVSKQSYETWSSFWNIIPVPFVPLDDFYNKYPQSEIIDQVRVELVRSLIDAETSIRLKAITTPRFSGQSIELLAQLRARLDKLQADLNQKSLQHTEK